MNEKNKSEARSFYISNQEFLDLIRFSHTCARAAIQEVHPVEWSIENGERPRSVRCTSLVVLRKQFV
jgi:hypothetical protein